ncbi:MAG: GGDEF domain-containing protein [Paracoccaceae bacterium]
MDGTAPADPALRLGPAALGLLMPLHVTVAADGSIAGAGPTLLRLLPGREVAGLRFFDLFRIRRPAGIGSVDALRENVGRRLDLSFHHGPPTGLRGIAVAVGEGALLLNLSFGIGVIEAVRRHNLTDADFPPTDLAVEMLYVVEAKSAVMEELRDLNLRLQGAKQLAEEQALTDTLTGLRNRRALEAVLVGLLRSGTAFGLLHIDLDFFKQVNDTLGHAAGDHVLCRVAEALLDETRAGDTVARVGGDEFVIVLPSLTGIDRMEQIAQRILNRLAEPIRFQDRPCAISASIGMVLSRDYAEPEIARLLSDADGALYASKRAGRGRAQLFRP